MCSGGSRIAEVDNRGEVCRARIARLTSEDAELQQRTAEADERRHAVEQPEGNKAPKGAPNVPRGMENKSQQQ